MSEDRNEEFEINITKNGYIATSKTDSKKYEIPLIESESENEESENEESENEESQSEEINNEEDLMNFIRGSQRSDEEEDDDEGPPRKIRRREN